MREGKPKPQNTEFRFSKGVREKAKINDNPIVADLDMLQKSILTFLKQRGLLQGLFWLSKTTQPIFSTGATRKVHYY